MFSFARMKAYLFMWLCGAFTQNSFSILSTKFARNTETKELNIANTFSGCLIYLTNFQGLNIYLPAITQPVVLLRYFSFPQDLYLYPTELNPIKPNKLNRWMETLNITAFKKTRTIWFENKTLSFPKVTFFRNTFNVTKLFRFSIKNTKCEANIYLHPPLQTTSPFMYHKSLLLGEYILKDPLWFYLNWNFIGEKWREDYINGIPKYSLLICNKQNDSICHNNNVVDFDGFKRS